MSTPLVEPDSHMQIRNIPQVDFWESYTASRSKIVPHEANRELSNFVPLLDAPRKIDSTLQLEGLKSLKERLHGISPREIMIELYSKVVEADEQSLKWMAEIFHSERNYSDRQAESKIKAHNELVAFEESGATWGTVAKTVACFGLIAAGIGSMIATGVTVIGVACVVAGTILAVDQLLNESAKKQIASWIAQGDRESQIQWLSRIQSFCGVISFALSIGINMNQAVAVAMRVSDAAVAVVENVNEYRIKQQKAWMITIDSLAEEARVNVNMLMAQMHDMMDRMYQFYERMLQSETMHNRSVKKLFQ